MLVHVPAALAFWDSEAEQDIDAFAHGGAGDGEPFALELDLGEEGGDEVGVDGGLADDVREEEGEAEFVDGGDACRRGMYFILYVASACVIP